MVVCAKLGMDFVRLRPQGADAFPTRACGPVPARWPRSPAPRMHVLTEDVDEGAAGASVIYTDIWVSMGESMRPVGQAHRSCSPSTRLTPSSWPRPADDAIFMHCLPSFHDRNTTIGEDIFQKFGLPELEVTDEVFESEQLPRLRRGREPHALHQGRHVRDAQGLPSPSRRACATSEKHEEPGTAAGAGLLFLGSAA